ncbi:MAG: ribbon-helix-helix protein, CopG family [Streptosporangiaceae bacterium]
MRKPETQLVNFNMDRATARRFLVRANELGLSRSEVLRAMIMDFLHETGHDD